MKQYFALVAAGKVVSLNYEELPDPVPDGLTIKTLTEAEYNGLVADFSYNLIVSDGLIVVDGLAESKSNKIKEAREYFHSIDKFTLNTEEYRIDKSSLRNLFTDLSIRDKDIAVNGVSACPQPFKGSEYIPGYSGNITAADALDVCLQVRCFNRESEAVLDTHITNIMACATVLDVGFYDETANYPTPIVIGGV